MPQQNNVTTQPINTASLSKRMLLGGGIALLLITIFLLGVKEPNPAWGKLWMIKPLVIVPAAGAIGGASYYFMDHLRYRFGWSKVWVIVLSLIVYIIGLFMGTVLGLDGTLWD